MAGEAREKCAVAAVYTENPESQASELVYENLYAMQHRGAEASGMASLAIDGRLHSHRKLGMVRDVYNERAIRKLAGSAAIGHNRYSTSGSKLDHPQPVKDAPIGFALSHNGNLPVTSHLETYLHKQNIDPSHLNDSEMMGFTLAQQIRNGQDLASAVEISYPLFRGAFSCVAMHDDSIVAFRDASGIRPLALGSFEDGYAVVSETCALDIIGAEYQREVAPGELLIISGDGIESRQIMEGNQKLDMFEFVYFARHDSQLYGQRVNEVRRRFGEQLAEQHPPMVENAENVVVVPIPDTSVPAAEGYADKLGLKHTQGIIKNRYIGRTFMQPTNAMRQAQLKRKHNVIPEVVTGKDVVLIDDSIVRLNTLPRIVEEVYQAGAKSVMTLVASPPVRFPDFYGIDTPKQSELAAANMTSEQMRQLIGSQHLGFLSMSRMIDATGLSADMFNLSCFNGEYPISIGNRKEEISTPVSMEYIE